MRLGLLLVALSAWSQTVPPSLLQGLQWRSIGPAATGGRIADLAVSRAPGEPLKIYAATTTGGIFKSINEGISWTPIFDNAGAMMSIGAIAVAPSNPNDRLGRHRRGQQPPEFVMGRRRLQIGRWRRLLAEGRTRRHPAHRPHRDPSRPTPTSSTSPPSDISGDPTPSAASSRPPTAGRPGRRCCTATSTPARPISRSIPQHPDIVFAAMYQRQRKGWGFNGGGPGSGIYRTRDGGADLDRS